MKKGTNIEKGAKTEIGAAIEKDKERNEKDDTERLRERSKDIERKKS